MELPTIDSMCSLQSAAKQETEKSMVFEFVDNVSVQSGNLERFNSVESFRTRTSTESYETACSSIFAQSGSDRSSKQASLYWLSLVADTSKWSYQTPQPEQQHDIPVKDKSLLSYEEFCRICHCGSEDEELISPCKCTGSAQYAHQSCLLSWFEIKQDKICELCLYEISVKKTGFKPLRQWRLPWRSCDIIAYLFVFYCVVLIVFIAMVFWIASRRCLSPICVVLYFACVLALCYFTYCCGCIENMRHFWRTWIDSNRQLFILTLKDIGLSPGAVSRSQNRSESQKAEYV